MRALALALLICLLAAACYTVPQTGRSAFNIIGPGEEIHLGVSAFDEIKKKEKLSTDTNHIEMVQRVGKRIAESADRDIPNAKWEFVLFENKEPNAFALPGGKVGVYTGILEITKDDAGLAAVMGHEVAHVAARHGAERMSQQLALAGLATGLSIGLSQEDKNTQYLAMIGFGLATTLGAVLPHSRMQESEADRIGLTYMAKAGYPPQEAVAFWQRFREYNQKKGGAPPAFLSTHPTDEKRIADLQKLVPEAEVYYKTSGRQATP
ncbi:MAG: M48 family metallopeptidase [Verrucomicrobia bacterium]|nr:M48 family metallopeptidase [Verrucomicrobiota bacterium]